LKLVEDLTDFVIEGELNEGVQSVKAYVNYTVRPGLGKLNPFTNVFKTLSENAEKRRYPKEWAVRKLQRNFRAWKIRKERMEAEQFEAALSKAVLKKEISRMSEEKAYEVRRQRAEDKIREMVREWRERRRQGHTRSRLSLSSSALALYTNMCNAGPGSLVAATCARACRGILKDCEVVALLREFANKNEKPWEDIEPVAHRIVTFNWIESMEDLAIIEDHHWDAWNCPERIVSLVKEEVALRSRSGYSFACCSFTTGTASCCIGDCVSGCCGWVSGFWAVSEEKDKEEERASRERRRARRIEEEDSRSTTPRSGPSTSRRSLASRS